MLDQVISLYETIINFLSKLHIFETVYEFRIEIAGFTAIILLLLIALSLRKRRKRKKIRARAGQPVDPLIFSDEDDTIPLPLKNTKSKIETADMGPSEQDDLVLDDAVLAPADAEFELSDDPSLADPDEAFVTEETFYTVEEEPSELETVLEIEEEPEEEEEILVKPETDKPKTGMGFLDRLKSGLTKTRQSLSKRFDTILSGNRKIDDDVLEEIEEVLITSDIGVPTTMELMQRIEKNADHIHTADEFKSRLKEEMLSLVNIAPPAEISEKPHVIMVVGVNGVGKTTTIGKLAAKFSAQGKKVLLSASDTFRAAAVEQLEVWANRAGADIVKHRDKSDPAAVAFDSMEAAVARDIDIVIVDTAGRLHTKINLMEELKKIKRSIGKKIPTAPHETFLVLDATTGQNAVSQAKLFNENIDVTGIVLTKLDGTAKGGIVLSICDTLNVPIRYIGVGEAVDDLQVFDPRLFVDALL